MRSALNVMFLCLLAAIPAAAQVVSERETFRPFAEGTLPFFYDLYTFRGEGGTTEVVAAFAVPAGQLDSRRKGNEVRYRFDVSLVLADTLLRTVTRSDDSVFVATRGSLGGDHLLFTHVSVQARPSSHTVQRVVMTDAATPGVGQLYDEPFTIPDYSGSRLMLSDIALGQPQARRGWRRGGHTLALFPTSQFPESSFDVYYEVYNLPYRDRYTTEITVQRLDDREEAGPPVRLRFDGRSDALADGVVRELRGVSGQLERGPYLLTVTIRNEETGETASRSRPFRVQGWAPGATLVVARPRAKSGK